MALYKDLNGKVYDDMNGEASDLLPAGCVQITLAEADAIRNPPPTPEQIYASKWALIDEYESTLEVTLANGHKYAANAESQRSMQMQIDTLAFDEAMTWIEKWDTFQTNAVELKLALTEAKKIIRAYTNLTFGV